MTLGPNPPHCKPGRPARPTALALACVAPLAFAACGSSEKTIDDDRRALHVESFDQVWVTVRDKHWDPDLNGVDWEAARDDIRPRVESAETEREARQAMNELIERLGQSHFEIIPREAYESLEREGGEGETGLFIRVRDGRALVTRVREGSPADEAGVRPGWILTRIDGRDVAEVVERVQTAYEDSPGHVETYVSLGVNAALAGPSGESIELEFIDGDDRERAMSLTRWATPGDPIRLANLPGMRILPETATLDSGIGYFTLNAFFRPPEVMSAFSSWVREHRDAPGLIIDLRGNIGGMGVLSMAMAGWLVRDGSHYLGTMTTREAELRWVVNPRPNAYDGPVAVLVDEVSISNSEILAGGLQSIGRRRVFGSVTAGMVLPAVTDDLPNGDKFLHAFADYISSDGTRLEGVGVVPDVVVEPTCEALLGGRDPALDAAVEWILSQQNTSG